MSHHSESHTCRSSLFIGQIYLSIQTHCMKNVGGKWRVESTFVIIRHVRHWQDRVRCGSVELITERDGERERERLDTNRNKVIVESAPSDYVLWRVYTHLSPTLSSSFFISISLSLHVFPITGLLDNHQSYLSKALLTTCCTMHQPNA